MRSSRGFTLIELVIVVAIVGILAAAVLPLGRWAVKRQREYELQQNLRIIRNAIDRYNDMAQAGLIEVGIGDTGFPPDLDVLVDGVDLIGEIPAPLQGVSGEFSASGAGLTGGLAGAQGAGAGGFGDVGGGGNVGGRGNPGGGGTGFSGADAGGRSGGVMSTSLQQLRGSLNNDRSTGQRGGGGLGLGQGLGLSGQASGRNQQAQGGRGGAPSRGFGGNRGGDRLVADVDKIVFLRRLPIDPFTGKADWGLRCYGDSIADRSWCGRNVFDVYSNARGDAMDGRPYREW